MKYFLGPINATTPSKALGVSTETGKKYSYRLIFCNKKIYPDENKNEKLSTLGIINKAVICVLWSPIRRPANESPDEVNEKSNPQPLQKPSPAYSGRFHEKDLTSP